MKKGNRIKNKWIVFKENHPTGHVCVLLVGVNVMFILLSALIISVLPENRGLSIPQILRLAFTLMVNPSGKYIYSEAPISLILTTVVVLLGMISLTGGTVGFITSIIQAILEKTANNARDLKMQNHIVILNYNNKVPAIIYDYSFDDMKNTYLVILANENKKKMHDEIENIYNHKGGKRKFKNIIIREGNPMSELDLDKINLKAAKTVLLMNPEGEANTNKEDDGFEVSKLFMYITWYFSDVETSKKANIVVEAGNTNMEKMVKEYYLDNNDQISVPVNYKEIMGKLLAVTAIMPSLNNVMKQLFSFEGAEIYIENIPEGKTILEELKENRSIMPMFDQDNKRVYIAEAEEEFGRTIQGYQLKKPLPEKVIEPVISFKKNEIIIVGVNSKLPYVLESLACYKKTYHNDSLHVIMADTKDKEDMLKSIYANEAYSELLDMSRSYILIEDIYNPMKELASILNKNTDTILFLSDDTVDDVHVDEKPLIYWTGLKKHIREKQNLDIIVEILDSKNQSIIELKNKDQIVVSDDFLGHLYAQLGKNPKRLDVIKDILTTEGDSSSENIQLELQNEGDIVCAGVEQFFAGAEVDLSFESKREAVIWTYEACGGKCILLGIVRDSIPYLFARTEGKQDSLDSTVLLGSKEGQIYPSKEEKLVLKPEDELILFMVG